MKSCTSVPIVVSPFFSSFIYLFLLSQQLFYSILFYSILFWGSTSRWCLLAMLLPTTAYVGGHFRSWNFPGWANCTCSAILSEAAVVISASFCSGEAGELRNDFQIPFEHLAAARAIRHRWARNWHSECCLTCRHLGRAWSLVIRKAQRFGSLSLLYSSLLPITASVAFPLHSSGTRRLSTD
jgi:hypothetical protein